MKKIDKYKAYIIIQNYIIISTNNWYIQKWAAAQALERALDCLGLKTVIPCNEYGYYENIRYKRKK